MTAAWSTAAPSTVDDLDTGRAVLDAHIPAITPDQAAAARRAAARWADRADAGHLALTDIYDALDIQETP